MGLLERLFKRKTDRRQAYIEIQNEYRAFSGTAWNSATFRAAVDAIARHAAKLAPHSASVQMEQALNTPNPYMSLYDLLYKTAAAYFTHNNAFLLLMRNDGGQVTALYPLIPQAIDFEQGANGELFAKCLFADGRENLFPYSDMLHLRRHFLTNDLLGEGNAPLFPLLDTAETLTQGIGASVKNGTSIRGVLKFTSLVNPAQVKKEKEQFVNDYMSLANMGGIAATDQRFDFVPTNTSPYIIPKEQTEAVNGEICAYLGINPHIVTGNYTENEFTAFYESIIEPFALQLSAEFAQKTGEEITFTAERMEFSSAETKIKLLHEAAPLGVITINEARKLLALPPVEGGEKRLQSLNYVSAENADRYQMEE